MWFRITGILEMAYTETICLKCLAKPPARRYASAAELEHDLDRFLGGGSILARPTPAWERGAKWARRPPATTLAVAVAARMSEASARDRSPARGGSGRPPPA